MGQHDGTAGGRALAMALCGALLTACGGGDPSPIVIPPSPPPGPAAATAPAAPPTTGEPTPAPAPPPPVVATAGCFGALEDGRIVALDLAKETSTPFGAVPVDDAGELRSFGLRGRELFTCSADRRVARVDLDKGDLAFGSVACEAVTADAKGIYVLAEGTISVLPSFDAKQPTKRIPLPGFPTFALGTSPSGLLAAGFQEEVVVVDPVTGALSFRKLSTDRFAMPSIAEQDGQTLLVDRFGGDDGTLLVFDATGQRQKALFPKLPLVGVSCSR